MAYSHRIEKELKKKNIKAGHRVSVDSDGEKYEGILMPGTGDPDHLVVKLDSGYNVGMEYTKNTKIAKKKAPRKKKKKPASVKPDPKKPHITIIHTGGTVASKIDYDTGAVHPQLTPEELARSVPELFDIANIRVVELFQMFSEDMEPGHWMEMARVVEKEVKKKSAGVIITHGTDTLHYTAAALSFMLQNLPVPVLLLGSQRSSDRGSSDAAMNLICAAHFVTKSGFNGVGVCMHGSMSDDFCYVHSGVHVKKMHTSRRDTFQSVDVQPLARVTRSGEIEQMREYPEKKGKFRAVPWFEEKVAIIKPRPGFSYKEFEGYVKAGYKGLVVEGTGLGHLPVTRTDQHTKDHPKLLKSVERAAEKGVVVAMASQAPYGVVNMNVYSTGRRLLDAGATPAEMLSEVAYVKLGWLLGQKKKPEKVRELMSENMVGEVTERIHPEAFGLDEDNED